MKSALAALKLRPYQREAIDAVHDAFAAGNDRVAVVLPTGLGKTVIFAELIRQAHADGTTPLVLVHREELAAQAAAKIRAASPGIRVGIVKAARHEVDDVDVIVASVQTLAHPARRESLSAARSIGLVIVDECHHAVARTWIDVLDHFGSWSGTPTVGFTATLARNDDKGLGDVWETIAYEQSIMYGIDRGYLSDVRGVSVTVDGFDLATVARSRGDYSEGKLGDAMLSSGAGAVIADAYVEHAGAQRGILFAPTVETAHDFARELNERGVVTAVITGATTTDERRSVFAAFEAGAVQVLANCMVLTEGFDAPHASVAVIARPTQSAGLYTQMVGRVLRPYPGKTEALVLDVVGISSYHKLRSLSDLTKTTVLDGESATEARARVDAEVAAPRDRDVMGGAAAHAEFELFDASHSVWLRTRGGVWFIPVTQGMVVLHRQDDGAYRVGEKLKGRGGKWLATDLPFEYGMAHGEQLAADLDPSVSSKTSAWRKTKPSQAQVDLATRLRLADADELAGMRKGALSDLISVAIASRDLDPR